MLLAGTAKETAVHALDLFLQETFSFLACRQFFSEILNNGTKLFNGVLQFPLEQ
jgi:hypothetical protein